MEQERYNELKLGERGAIVSIIAYLVLAVVKLIVGTFAGSSALKADGFNNTTDIVASLAVLIGLKLSQKPADEDHPYGHWKAETVATLVASFIMMVVGIQVLADAVPKIFTPIHEAPNVISAWTGVLSAIIMIFVYRYNMKLGKAINSQAVIANAKDNLSDAFVSIGATIGIIGAQFQLPWLDPTAAVIVGVLICKTAWGLFRNASYSLTDGFDEEKLNDFKETALTVKGIKDVKQLKARNYGNNTVVDIIVVVESTLDIATAHDLASQVEEILKREYQVYEVHVHVEPCEAHAEFIRNRK